MTTERYNSLASNDYSTFRSICHLPYCNCSISLFNFRVYLVSPTINTAATASMIPKYTGKDNFSPSMKNPSIFTSIRLDALKRAIVLPSSSWVNIYSWPNVAKVRSKIYAKNHQDINVETVKPCACILLRANKSPSVKSSWLPITISIVVFI